MINLIGTFDCKVDSKGRLMFPIALKKQLSAVLSEGFILKRSIHHHCLELYPMLEWNKEAAGVNKLNRFVKKNTDFIRMFMAGVRTIELDDNGRLLIPKDLVTFAEIAKDIVVTATVNRVEIWSKTKYEAVINDPNVDFSSLAEDVMGNIDLSE